MKRILKRLKHSGGGAILEYLPLSSFILLAAIAAVQFAGESQANALCSAGGFGQEM